MKTVTQICRALIIALLCLPLVLTGCTEDDGINQPIEKTKEAIDEAGQSIEDATNDAINKVEKGLEGTGESGQGATDR